MHCFVDYYHHILILETPGVTILLEWWPVSPSPLQTVLKLIKNRSFSVPLKLMWNA